MWRSGAWLYSYASYRQCRSAKSSQAPASRSIAIAVTQGGSAFSRLCAYRQGCGIDMSLPNADSRSRQSLPAGADSEASASGRRTSAACKKERPRTLGIYLLSLPILAYRWLVSPWLGPRCRYLPTCSDYALDALAQHGAIRGGWLAVCRIARCHPFGGHGYDPVPPRFEETSSECDPDSPDTNANTGLDCRTSF